MLDKEKVLELGLHDEIDAVVIGSKSDATIIFGNSSLDDDVNVLWDGQFVVRYTIPYLYESDFSLNPAYILTEYGGELENRKAWAFMFKRYAVNPRTEVFGLRTDGEPVMVFQKELDMVTKVKLYAYHDAQTSKPFARITGYEVLDDTVEIPKYLQHYLKSDEVE